MFRPAVSLRRAVGDGHACVLPAHLGLAQRQLGIARRSTPEDGSAPPGSSSAPALGPFEAHCLPEAQGSVLLKLTANRHPRGLPTCLRMATRWTRLRRRAATG